MTHLKLLMNGVLSLTDSFIGFLSVKSNPAKPTVAYAMHVSKEPQDDDYTVISSPEKTALEMNESDLSLTFESSSDNPKRKKTPREVRSKETTSFQLDRAFFLNTIKNPNDDNENSR